ncbi:MAG: AAA family ATPase [Planctomycetes bacterium]|nr:AAA family ATPase [Planctomycetota bacterium]
MGQRSNTAANTLTRRRYGWDASNTDIEGFLRDLLHYTDNTRLSDCRTLVLGSGGAAFAVMQALKGRCKRLCVFARNREKGRALAAKHKAIFIEQPYSYGTPFSLVINATSAGMAGGPAENEVPVDLASLPLESNAAVYDLVYNPPETPFLKEANRLGLRARGGLGMLVQQAHAQLLSWSMLHGGSIFTCAGQEELDEQALSYALHRKHIYPPQCIALVGYRGAGKTTVGQRLADKLGLLLVDLDREIENRIQQSIADIFAREGEAAFRKYEEQALKACCQMLPPYVLAVGGGIVETPACRKMLREHYTVIWLDASPEVLRERLSKDSTRPALEAGGIDEELRVRLPRRTPFYESIADFIVKVEPGDDVDTTTRKVLSFLVPQA